MNLYNVINLHLTESCNFHCRYCFAKFGKDKEITFEQAKLIVDNISDYYKTYSVENGRINLAGGEPLIVPYLDELIGYIRSENIKVSIITNGYLLTKKRIKSFTDRLDSIGISVDSLDMSTNITIGRCTYQDEILTYNDLIERCNMVREARVLLKINTVVSRYNLGQAANFSTFYKKINAQRIKILQMRINENINDVEKYNTISSSEFELFFKELNIPGCIIETAEQMEDAYVMIDPKGNLISNASGKYTIIGSCLDTPIENLLTIKSPDIDKFEARYNIT